MTNKTHIELLIEQLSHDDHTIRYEAAQKLGTMQDDRAIQSLIDALPDSNHKVQYAALSGLVKHGDTRAAEPIIAMLLIDPRNRLWELLKLNIGMRLRNGLLALVQAGDDHIADLLIAALNDEEFDELQRAYIVKLLGRTADYRVVDAFIGALTDDSSDEMRAAAADALGWINHESAIEPLIKMLGDRNTVMREIAVDALGRMGNTRAVEPLMEILDSDESEWVRRVAALALGDINDSRAIEPLAAALNDYSADVREAAFEALKKFSA